METQSRILKVARDQFFTLGFSKVTMDEIARDVGMSKRTLYEHFPGKKALLRKALVGKTETIAHGFEEILSDSSSDFPQKLKAALHLISSEMPAFSHAFLRDIQRHAPEIWEELDERRQRLIRDKFGRLLNQGIKEDYLRKGLNPELLILLVSTLIQNLLNPQILSTLPISAPQAFQFINEVVFEGILTEVGRRKLHETEP
jgi:AcrR family transcriptional regulator